MRILRRAEVRAVEDFLQRQNLYAAAARFFDQGNVGVDRRLANGIDGRRRIGDRRSSLNQAAENASRHHKPPDA
jgi:hypothetical protein